MEDKYIIEQTENSITWDYGVPVENYDEWLSGYTNTYTGEELNNMLKVDEAIKLALSKAARIETPTSLW